MIGSGPHRPVGVADNRWGPPHWTCFISTKIVQAFDDCESFRKPILTYDNPVQSSII